MTAFRFPDASQRTAVLGMTGSGKSVFASWLLSHSSYDRRPWLIVDHKDEEIFSQINRKLLTEIDPGDGVPSKPGLYITRPLPESDDAAMSQTFDKIWRQGDTGIYVDEGALLDRYDRSFNTILVTGRSRHIPVIFCCQRPVGASQYVFTQSNNFAVFQLEGVDDQKRVKSYLGEELTAPLPTYHCRWRSRADRSTIMLAPVEDPETIVDRINRRAPGPFWV